jgi:hypothetical protein
VRPQVLAQQLFVERLTHLMRAWVRVRIDQTGQDPALGDQFGSRNRFVGPPVPVRVQVDDFPVWQPEAPNPQNRHSHNLLWCFPLSQHLGP